MQTVADMRGVGVKNRGKFADVLCGRPLILYIGTTYTCLFDLWFVLFGCVFKYDVLAIALLEI